MIGQCELQAPGLAVFPARGCAAQSPLRFVVVNDPVQSMDSPTVDGLA
ncbi:hypothetical protein AB0K04_08590 [Micromonospora coxensis]